jgi:hypothetical protein
MESVFTVQMYVKFNIIYERGKAHLWFSLLALSVMQLAGGAPYFSPSSC